LATIFVSLLLPPSRAYVTDRPSPTGQWFVYYRIPRNWGSSTHPFTKLWQAPRPPFELGIRDDGEGQGQCLPKEPHRRVLPPSYWRCRALSGLATLLTLAFRTLRPSSALGIIEGVILRLSRPLALGACVCGGVDGMAACGCWSWLVFDGREGVRRALVVFERRRARLSARRLDGDPVDLAAGRPKPRKILYQC
jgi:hypothetical protein